MRLFKKLHWECLLKAADLLLSEQETDSRSVLVGEHGDSWKPFVRTSWGPWQDPNPGLVLLCPALCRPSQASFMWKSFGIFSFCCLIAPLFDPSCTPYVHALTLKGLPQENVSLLLPVMVLTVPVSHPPGLLAERAGLCGHRPRCLSCPRGWFCSFKRHTWKSLFKMMHPLHEDFMWADFKLVFFLKGQWATSEWQGKGIFQKQMKECFFHHMDLSFGIDLVPCILNILVVLRSDSCSW